jgi:hypothetical protein
MITVCNKEYLLCDNCEEVNNCNSKDRVVSTKFEGNFNYIDTDNVKEFSFIQLKDIQTLAEVSRIYGISKVTLIHRLDKLEEGKDYRKLGERQSILLTPTAVEKIINIKGVEL